MTDLTISQLKTTVEAARNHIDVQLHHHAEAVEDYAGMVGHASDDELDMAETAVAHYAGLVTRAKARHTRLCDELVETEAKARKAVGDDHAAQAQAGLARIQSLMNESASLADRAEEIAALIASEAALVSEQRRLAVHHGVKVAYAPTLNPPDLAKAHAAFCRIAGTGGYIWRPM